MSENILPVSAAGARRPNILWLNADHFAYAHHFALNRRLICTPAFNRLCAEGVRFENAYTVCPLCTPARASLVTGQYPHRHGILNNDGAHGSRDSFAPDAPLLPRELEAVGYRAALFGKWHAEGHSPHLAQDVGFEGWSPSGYGDPYASPLYENYLRERGLPKPEVEVEWHLSDASLIGQRPLKETGGEAAGVRFHPSSGVILGAVETHEAHFLAFQAIRYLTARAEEQKRATGAPFCLRVDPWGPHQPYFVAPPFANSVHARDIPVYPSFEQSLENRPAHHAAGHRRTTENAPPLNWNQWQPVVARCYEHIALVDAAFDSILQALQRLGLAENTLVIYSADHGDLLAAHGGGFDKGWFVWEETVRIPLALRFPNVASARKECRALVSNLDIVATIREIAGVTADAPTDGQTLLPLVQNPNAAGRDDLMLESHGHFGVEVVQRVLRHANWKYVASLDDRDELYDLESDPYELCNRANDAVAHEVLREMRLRLRRVMEESDDTSTQSLRLRAQLDA